MESVLRDLRLAARGLWQNPGFTAVAVLTLALGIGATTAVFSVVYGVLLRPLPFPNADRLIEIVQILEPEAPGEERHRAGLRVSTRFLGGLGVPPLLGRTFQDDDAARGADPVVVLAERTWRRYFGGDENIIGRRIMLDEVRTRVVGVMPASYRFPSLAGPGVTRDSVGDLERGRGVRRHLGDRVLPAVAPRDNCRSGHGAAERMMNVPADTFPAQRWALSLSAQRLALGLGHRALSS